MYIVPHKRMYRLSADRTGRPHIDREMSYRNSGIPKPSQVDASSGATPTIPPGGPVAITDNADPTDAVAYRTATRLRHHQHRVVCQVPEVAKTTSASENSLIGSGRSLGVENNYGYQDPFGPYTGAITRPGFARMDINKHVNGSGLEWTNHTESAPSVGTKALHDNLACAGRSEIPHLARSSHGIGAETPVRPGRSRTKGAARAAAAARLLSGGRGSCGSAGAHNRAISGAPRRSMA